MKIRVTLKDPDSMADSVRDAVSADVKQIVGVLYGEAHYLIDDRTDAITEDITTRWMRYGEYLTVEFDTEAGTATVVPNAD